MKLAKKKSIIFFTFFLLLLHFRAQSYEIEPFEDKSLPESKELSILYLSPMVTINRLLGPAEQHCSRLPSEKEFKEFILNGEHKSIRCSKTIKAAIPMQRTGDQIGKNLPHVPEFLKRNQYKVHSNTKSLFVILKHNPNEWKYKYFKPEEYEFVIQCTLGHGTCKLHKIKDMASSCRASETFAKNHCYFNGKKIIDY
ncbi:MAG: hypothetical protein NDI69_18215 [Bacteriovoracaceae bacterium]|nr:hypothetical protein [Bacteriovoracaceae bacterium]